MINFDTDTGANVSANRKSPVLLLSIHNAKDRGLIRQYLPDFFIIDVNKNGIGNTEFDLCILDEQSWIKNREVLLNRKKESAPVFLPVMLLSPNQERIRQNASLLEHVDDVVYIPASPELLHSRVEMLLRQREYSLKLEQKNRELEQILSY